MICRSGASTIAELAAVGRPALLVPYPHATDDHQSANARAFAEAGAARVIPQPEFTPAKLTRMLNELLGDPAGLRQAAARARGFAPDDAADRLAALVLSLTARAGSAGAGARGMRSLPDSIGPIHFVGIGGIGMSGIAEVLHNLGYRVQGSDLAEGGNTRRLLGLGIPVRIGHAAENLDAAEVVVISSAVKPDNPEVIAARARRLPVVRRAEMLAELMRLKWAIAIAGTHGKTTTTSMIGSLLETAGLDPTVINGGIINAYGTNTRLGAGDWMAVEADESDGTFTRLPATVAIVTNIDPEHLDFYGDVAALHQAFENFVSNIPFYGFAVLCIDHPVVQGLIPRVSDRRIVTYGFGAQADYRAANVRHAPDGSRFDAVIADRYRRARAAHPRTDSADVRRAQRAERDDRDRGRRRAGHRRRSRTRGLAQIRRRAAAFYEGRRMERRLDHRRLRPPPGRDRGRAESGARGGRRAA